MVRAFITVQTSAGKSPELLEDIHRMDAVVEAHVVAGEYDIIAEAEGDEVYTVINAVATDLHELDGIIDTRTYVCLE